MSTVNENQFKTLIELAKQNLQSKGCNIISYPNTYTPKDLDKLMTQSIKEGIRITVMSYLLVESMEQLGDEMLSDE